MTDTPETLQSALADLTRRVAAFEQAQKAADVEPPMLTGGDLECLEKRPEHEGVAARVAHKAAARLRYVEAELARLREGLKVRESDITSLELLSWGDDDDFEYSPEEMRSYIRSQCRAMAREIQRHRALVTK